MGVNRCAVFLLLTLYHRYWFTTTAKAMQSGLHRLGFDFLQLKPIRDPVEHIRLALDVVEFGDLRGGVAEEVGYLFGGEGFDVAVFIFCAVD